MTLSKINKEYSRLLREENDRDFVRFERDTFLISDSKGRYLQNEITREFYGKIKIISRSGASIDDANFQQSFLRNIELARCPIVFFWFGTCELTFKQGKYIELRPDPYSIVEQVITKYRDVKNKILHLKPNASISYIDCPYYSLTEWNRKKGCNNISVYQTADKELESVIDFYNQEIKTLNIKPTPRLSQDIIRSSKPKKAKNVKYTKNYSLYLDGVHPNNQLSKLWLHKLLKLKYQIETA